MRLRIYAFSFLTFLMAVFNGCSVADPTKTLNPASGLPGVEAPAQPATPVLVSEPIPVVSAPVENLPESAPIVTTPTESTPVTGPSGYPLGAPIGTPTDTSVTPVEVVAPTVPVIPEEIPEPIAVIEETPTSPAANVIDVTEIVNVSVPVSAPAEVQPENQTEPAGQPDTASNQNSHEQPMPASEPILPVEVAPVSTPIPPAIMEIVEISNPGPSTSEPIIAIPTLNDDEDENQGGNSGSSGNSNNGNVQEEDNSDTEFTVSGSCLGKKSAGVVWYDNRDKNKKQNKSVKCKNNKFEIKIKDKKKNLPYLEIQTLFYD